MLDRIIRFFLEQKLIAFLLLLALVAWGIAVAPFNWEAGLMPRDPVPVDAIPNLGENQQIVYTAWEGRSPQDVEDQITYPLTTQLLSVPGVKSVRSSSMFGRSSIYVIFEEEIEFYWSRSRILEKLNALPAGLLPDGVQPALGPDATALGQIFWYTLEGRDSEGNTTGGWDLQELRTIQDFLVGYALSSVSGVAEVAPIGGYVKEYQVDVDPDRLKMYDLTLSDLYRAVKGSNAEVGARTVELNRVEYLVRGLGYVSEIADIEEAVIRTVGTTPVKVKDVAQVGMGPALRRGALDRDGAEAVGAVVVAREGANPMEVITQLKQKIAEIAPGLPQKELADGTTSQVQIVPFYDRTQLIDETLGTLEEALNLEVLITIIVIVVMVLNFRISALISAMLPIAILMTFIAMKLGGVDANIVALSGIAIAIGTIVDMGVILSENMLRHMEEADDSESILETIFQATSEVASAVLTAVLTTIISFLPVFTMVAQEGKLFRPLAYTKTFALIASIIITITLIPPFAHWLFSIKVKRPAMRLFWNGMLVLAGIGAMIWVGSWPGFVLLLLGVINGGFEWMESYSDLRLEIRWQRGANIVVVLLYVSSLLAKVWIPLGPLAGGFLNWLFVALLLGLLMGSFYLVLWKYRPMLHWCLDHKGAFLSFPAFFVFFALLIWLGFATLFGFIPKTLDAIGWDIRESTVWTAASETFPGLGEEFMPSLNEGAFLLMPTTMPHAGIEETVEQMQLLDMLVADIPEVEEVVGKMGRVESALDPAPISMYENLIQYKSEYKTDADGHRIRFRVDEQGEYLRDKAGELIPDPNGLYFRQWRDHITSRDDIWQEIVDRVNVPGITSAPKLQPIETRLVMLQTGMRAPLGVKVRGPDLRTLEQVSAQLEALLQQVDGIRSQSVFAERVVGKPYLEIEPDREKLARYGITMAEFQDLVRIGIGGDPITQTVEGRERYRVRVRFARELRDSPEAMNNLLLTSATGAEIPLGDVAHISYRRGPQVIKSEDTFLVNYVIFDKQEGIAEVDVVERAQAFLQEAIDSGQFTLPAGVSYQFAGTYENQVRATKRLAIILPLTLFIIFLIVYFQFRSVAITLMVFTGIVIAWSGGFLLIWLYGQGWFFNLELLGQQLRELFQMGTVNLSVAVWVGFIALFGIAADGGIVLATYLQQIFRREPTRTISEVKRAVLKASERRIRPTLMTTATTILALIPVLTSTGKGAAILIPMAIPSVGGMFLQILALFTVPVLFSWWKERTLSTTETEQQA